jgi:ribosomal-protein-alanine N-acetyltransferase
MDEIRTARLLLRRAKSSDLDAMHKVLSDPLAMRYWSTPPHATLEETRRWLEDTMSAPESESDDFIIAYRGEAIGKAGCWRVPEIGFILHSQYWGQGLAREALSAILPRIYERFSVPAITADVDPRNTQCLNLLTRLGFEETGRAVRTWQVGDEWCDSVYLARKNTR